MSHWYTKDQLVFVDETSFDHRVARRKRGWAAKGQRALKKVTVCRGKRSAAHKQAFKC